MITNISPKELAIDLLARSVCSVQVAAVIYDGHGIFGWGWNSIGPDGFGWHAEAHAISRCSRRRLAGATIAVAGRRQKSRNFVNNCPCIDCQLKIDKVRIAEIEYLDKGEWKVWPFV